jgi:chromate reductase
MPLPTLLGLPGSLRSQSTNRLLLREAARVFADATYVEADLNLPLYNGDHEREDGIPAEVMLLVDQIAAADGVLISTPEYNKGISGVLKNALDWVSRTEVSPWPGKPVAIMSAAAGRSGGELGQSMLRACMVPFRAQIMAGPQVHLANSRNEFDENGRLKSEAYVKTLTALMTQLHTHMGR